MHFFLSKTSRKHPKYLDKFIHGLKKNPNNHHKFKINLKQKISSRAQICFSNAFKVKKKKHLS
jgi:hypothetical protein